MRTLTVDEVDAVSGAHPIDFWALAAYLCSKVTATGVAYGVGAGIDFGAMLVAHSD